MHLSNVPFFSAPEEVECREFVSILFRIPEVDIIEISASRTAAEIHFDGSCTAREFARKVGEELLALRSEAQAMTIPLLKADCEGIIRIYRHETVVLSWRVVSDLPQCMRLRNTRLLGRESLCQALERKLKGVFGIKRLTVNPLTCFVSVHFDNNAIDKAQLVDLLEETLESAEQHLRAEKNWNELLLCTAGLALSATAQFAVPILLTPAAGLFVYCVFPSFVRARDTLFKERRLGVDVLDAIVVVMCLVGNQIFAGATLAWCLSLGRALLAKAHEDSRRRLIDVFGKQARAAYLYQDGVEVSVPLERLRPGDTIAVHTGEVIPVDGIVSEGEAVVDQHALTGESVPVEKTVGSRIYASTLLIGGRILVAVEKAGKETTSAKISAILNDTAAFRLISQSKGEELADKAVLPTLILASMGYGTVGFQGATAIVNADFGTGIRMAAPLALLSSLSTCAKRGILVKDGKALEQMSSIDTVLFDKTGTLTSERPTVNRIHRFGKLGEKRILSVAAAAERRLDHPIAGAIVDEFRALGTPFPATDQSSYKIGYGISVLIEKKHVLIGSSRFMKLEGAALPERAERIEQEVHAEGHSIVFVSINKAVVGAIELAPTLRPGVRELLAGLRERGVSQVVIISGDHEKPTEKLARELGVDRYFAEVLPADKARYVELLQQEGRKVCFVGDGINDSIALKRANVSVSLRGATSVATDTAQLVFMEETLCKLCEFMDISRELERNINTSWMIIVAPNVLCIAGAFFLGFGVMASVVANNVAAIAALANGLRPLRMFPETGAADLAPERKGSSLGTLIGLVDLFRQLAAGSAVHFRSESPAGISTMGTGVKRTALLLLLAGAAGIVSPGVPGWPLIQSAIALLSTEVPGLSLLHQWLGKVFPNASREALRFAFRLSMDVKKRFPEEHRITS
ncbi:MAG: heavy metal translocating P-type ATPase [Gammaproteobacteria bacterium]